jgi:hypothetical protein
MSAFHVTGLYVRSLGTPSESLITIPEKRGWATMKGDAPGR